MNSNEPNSIDPRDESDRRDDGNLLDDSISVDDSQVSGKKKEIGRGADVAWAMSIPIFGGMLVEPFSAFVVPTV